MERGDESVGLVACTVLAVAYPYLRGGHESI